MGYGRINVFQALDFAEAFIKDNPADTGSVPFSGNFWGNSDIVVRQNDDTIFSYEPAMQGQKNYIYVRVNNLGPAEARNLVVSVRAVPFVSTEFVYPSDWTTVDATHIQPTAMSTNFPSLPVGATVDAKFRLSKQQVDILYGWETSGWHPCLLAEVNCENDYGTPVGIRTWLNNNLAQRNISTVPNTSGSSVSFPFVSGHKLNTELFMELVIDRHRLPPYVELFLDPSDNRTYFPALDLAPPGSRKEIKFLERTRMAVSLCNCDGILTLEAGSSFEVSHLGSELSLEGGEFIDKDGKQLIAIRENQAILRVPKRPGEMRQFSLMFRIPDQAKPGDRYQIDVNQRNTRQTVVGVQRSM
jgi:hypothetical protein